MSSVPLPLQLLHHKNSTSWAVIVAQLAQRTLVQIQSLAKFYKERAFTDCNRKDENKEMPR